MRAVDGAAEMALDDVRMALGRERQRHHDRPLGRRLVGVRAHRDVEVEVDHVLGGVVRTARRALERVEVERADRRELPARLALELGQREARRLGGGGLAALREELRLGDLRRSHQPIEPSICSSIRRFISTAYSIGSSLTIGSMKPLTISLPASSSERPCDIR